MYILVYIYAKTRFIRSLPLCQTRIYCINIYLKNRSIRSQQKFHSYGVATISRMGLFAEYESLLQGSFAEETYNFKEPTDCSHPIAKRYFIRIQKIFLS